jgi:hypothetical protein
MLNELVWRTGEVMAMDDSEGAIYTPPKNGLPFLVVTFSDGDMQTQTTKTRSEARALLARRTRRRRLPEMKQAEPARPA